MRLDEITQKKAESDFLFGDCASFAVAFQQIYGGQLFALVRNEQPLHIFVKLNGKNYDVVGQRGTYSMALSIVGSGDNFVVAGPYQLSDLPCRKATPKKIEIAKNYISVNSSRYNVS